MAYQPEIEKLEQRYAADPGRNFAQLAEAYRRDGRLDQALDVLHMHLQDRPDYVSGLVVLGRCLLERAEDVEARQTFEHVLTLDAEHIIALKALADIAERGGDVDGALGWLQRLLEVDPMNDDAQEALERLQSAPAPVAPPAPEPPAPAPAPAPEPALPETMIVPQPAPPAERPPAPVLPEAPPAPVAKTVIEAAVPPPGDGAPAPPAEAEPETPAEPDTVEQAPIRLEPEGEPEPEPVAEPQTPVASSGVAETIMEIPATAPEPRGADAEVPPPEAAPQLGATVQEEAVPWPERPPAKDLVIERASAEYDVVAADLEPVDVERSSEADLPEATPEAPPAGEDDATLQMAADEDLDATAPMFPSVAEPMDDTRAAGDAPEEGALPVEPFDSSLGWGTGERVSRQITEEDVAEAERTHEDGLAAAYQELPGLEDEDAPPVVGGPPPVVGGPPLDIVANATIDTQPEPVEGLEPEDFSVSAAEGAAPLEGLEPTSTEMDAEEPPVAAPEAARIPDDGEGTGATDAAVADAIAASVLGAKSPDPEPATEEVEASPPVTRPAEPVPQRRGSLEGLPLLLPDPEEEPEPEPAVEPAPVVTETMAEVYAKQGLIDEARHVYRQLLASRPGDAVLRARLEALDAQTPAAPADRRARYSASASGAESARAFLQAILAGQAAAVPPAAPATPAEVAAAETAEPDTPLAEAFGDEQDEDGQGAPTQPAADEMSLASVFGEAPSPAPKPPAGEAQAAARPPSGAFSFDEFFGNTPATPARPSGGTRRRDTMADDEGDDAFRDWLKGLKG